MVILQFKCHHGKTFPWMQHCWNIFICDTPIWRRKTRHFSIPRICPFIGVNARAPLAVTDLQEREGEMLSNLWETATCWVWGACSCCCCSKSRHFLLTECDTEQHINTAARIWQAVDAAHDSREQRCEAQGPAALIRTGKWKSPCSFKEYQCKQLVHGLITQNKYLLWYSYSYLNPGQ